MPYNIEIVTHEDEVFTYKDVSNYQRYQMFDDYLCISNYNGNLVYHNLKSIKVFYVDIVKEH